MKWMKTTIGNMFICSISLLIGYSEISYAENYEGVIVYAQAPSPINQAFNSVTEENGWVIYENFSLSSSHEITAISWRGQYYDPAERGALEGFTIKFWSNTSEKPGDLLHSEVINGVAGETSVYGQVYDYFIELSSSFDAVGGEKYWVSIQARLSPDSSTWGWSKGDNGDSFSWQKSSNADSDIETENDSDVTFQLYENSTNPTPSTPKTYGLFIGENYYEDGKLFKFKDSALMAKNALVTAGQIREENTRIFDSPSLTKEQIELGLDSFGMKSGDKLYFYYSGHGNTSDSPSHQGESFLSPGDEYLMTSTSVLLYDDDLYQILSKFNHVDKFVILDACKSGGFWGSSNETGGDLDRLQKVMLLAAASENWFTYTMPTGITGFSTRFAEGLSNVGGGKLAADKNNDSTISKQEWGDWFSRTYLNKYLNWPYGYTKFWEQSFGDSYSIEEVEIKSEIQSTENYEFIISKEDDDFLLMVLPAILSAVKSR